jgi:hypothetical protein
MKHLRDIKWRLDDKGYLVTGKKSIKQHRLVWEIYHGAIPKSHVIHHKNGIKTDNRIENLECLLYGDHSKLHLDQERELGVIKNCIQCGKKFISVRGKKYCNRSCKGSAANDKWMKSEGGRQWVLAYQKKWQHENRDKCREYERRYLTKRGAA